MSQFQKHPTIVEATFLAGQHGGSWKITHNDGEPIYLSDTTFKGLYYPVGKDKCIFCKHEQRHKTSNAVCDRNEVCMFHWREPNVE